MGDDVDLALVDWKATAENLQREVTRLSAEHREAVGAVADLVDNYAATDEQAFESAHARACRVIASAATPEREHPMPGNVLRHTVDLNGDYAGEKREVVTTLAAGVIVTSAVQPEGVEVYDHTTSSDDMHHGHVLHRPVLDIDLPVRVVESSTPGHHHLYIDHPMSWAEYLPLLQALAAAGLVEDGYVRAAERRGYTAVRLPWIRKGDELTPREAARAHAAAVAAAGTMPEPVLLDEAAADPWAS